MAQTSRIPTPFKQHLHRFRVGLLPAMSFLFCVLFTVWLWQRQGMIGTVMGEVQGETYDVVAGVDGELKAPPGGTYWDLFDVVKQGQPIAYLDDSLIRAQIKTIQGTAETFRKELESTTAEFEQTQFDLEQQRERDFLRLKADMLQLDAEMLRHYPAMKRLEAEKAKLSADLEQLKRYAQQNLPLLDEMDLRTLQREFDGVSAELQASISVVKSINEQKVLLQKELDEFPQVPSISVDRLLAPILQEIEVQNKLVEELEVQLDDCVIRSPIDGVISTIWRRPGQRVGAADPIVTVAKADSSYILGYVRDKLRFPVYPGMEVGLRLPNQPNSPEYTGVVESVSPQVAALPLDRLADQNVMELATWIKIPIPPELMEQKLRPRQTVYVIVRPSRSE